MNYAEIKPMDIANGIGIRVSLFVSGCRNHCKGCFNPELWRFDYGEHFDGKVAAEIIERMNYTWIAGLSVLGGDPFEPENEPEIQKLLTFAKSVYPEKSIWVYTGYLFEDLANHPIMEFIDVLVDGRFEIELKDPRLCFKGSSNQRIIDVQETRKAGKIILWEGDQLNV